MGFLIIVLAIPIILFILGLIFMKKENRCILLFLVIFLLPILGITCNFWSESQFNIFQKKYIYITSIKLSDVNNIDWKIDYLNDVKWINDEIQYAKKYHDSFWYGAFTDERLINFSEVIIIDN